MRDDEFVAAFGSEWFNISGSGWTAGPTDVTLLPGLERAAIVADG
jgi:hypothetical protein